MLNIVVQKFPNNEIRFGLQSLKKGGLRQGDSRDVLSRTRYAKAVQDIEDAARNLAVGCVGDFDKSGRFRVSNYDKTRYHLDVRRPLDIIDEFQERSCSSKIKGGWGHPAKLTTFGKKARHTLLQAGAVVDKECGKNIYEVTCTIPGSTPEAFEAVANWSGWIINRLIQPLRDHSKDALWFYVWELQKRGALHLHFAIAASTLVEAKRLAQQLEYDWWELLLELSEKAKVDVFRQSETKSWRDKPKVWQSHVSPVRKSVAAYFSKYLGKAVTRTQVQKVRGGVTYCPARWWGCSSKVKRLIMEGTQKYQITTDTLQSERFVHEFREFLRNPGRVSQYRYEFDLGISAQGYAIGHGWREINYYKPEAFAVLSSWLDYVVDRCCQVAGMSEDCIVRTPTDVCTEFDLIHQFRANRATSSPSPSNQRSSHQSDSLLSRGTQAKPPLDRKVIDVRCLRKGVGKLETMRMSAQGNINFDKLHTPATWSCMQLTLFDLYKYS